MIPVKSPYETYDAWERRAFCDNASRRGHGVSVSPQCLSGSRDFVVTVSYNSVDRDTMTLCKTCMEQLKRDARKHGYTTTAKKVNA